MSDEKLQKKKAQKMTRRAKKLPAPPKLTIDGTFEEQEMSSKNKRQEREGNKAAKTVDSMMKAPTNRTNLNKEKEKRIEVPKDIVAKIHRFLDWCMKMKLDGVAEEFNKNKSYLPLGEDYKWEAFAKNQNKCRYHDIVCIDRTRVKLQQVDPKDDFIHANFLNFGDETYIATQYPLEDTISDFWRMVFFEEPRIIINLVPKGQQYPSFFKTGEGEYHTYKDMYVQTRRVEESKSYMISYLLEVLPDGHSNSIFVRLLHILNWPDNRTTKGLHTILKALHILAKKDATLCKGPPVVMCNSGLNKCGTLIFTNLMINNLFSNSSNEVSPISIYMNMRRMRASIIQTDLYYLQALIIVLDYLQWKNEKKLILDLTPEMLRIIREWKMEFYKKYEKEKTNG